jgi:N-acetylglucosamine-6-phosphate deacetylase
MPTVATNTQDVFFKSIDAVRAYLDQDREGILGLHIEGPWLNPLRRGAHIESLIHSPSVQEVRELLDRGEGVIKMITLAPEVCSDEVIDLILSRGIIISAGHSNATYEQGKKAFGQGIQAATHLFNAMSPLHHREPGLPAAIINDEKAMASIIPDGHHVDFEMIRLAKSVMKERLFAITDAVTETDQGYYPHQLAGDKYESSGILSGSALSMVKAMKNLVHQAGIELGEAIRMCSLYPARVIGREHELGMIAPGYICKLVVLDEDLELRETLF